MWCSRINDCCIKNLTRTVDNGKLTSCPECRIPSKYITSGDRWLHKKLLKIFTKYLYSSVFCLLCKLISYITLNGRCDKSFITVFDGSSYYFFCFLIITCNNFLLKITDYSFFRCDKFYDKKFFFFTAVYCQYPVTGYFFYLFFKFIIHLIYGLLFFILCRRCYDTFLHCNISYICSVFCII